MKILLRDFNGELYTWNTAKYNEGNFIVGGAIIQENNIVSVLNDNRNKYVQCSKCGKVFRKGYDMFEIHKHVSPTPTTCMKCKDMYASVSSNTKKRYVPNGDGSYTEKVENIVRLMCGKYGCWDNYEIGDERAIGSCKYRQCANAVAEEIHDIFTDFPGVFDDIITVDTLLDAEWFITSEGRISTEYCNKNHNYFRAIVNKMNIVKAFYIQWSGNWCEIHYSKKYDKLFMVQSNKYVELNALDDYKEELKALYR